MTVVVRDKQLKSALEAPGKLTAKYGAVMAKKIVLRMQSLRSAETLADFWPPRSGPERCHELIGDMSGTYSMDLQQPYRLLFKHAAPALIEDGIEGKEKWGRIRSIDIVGIEDTHG